MREAMWFQLSASVRSWRSAGGGEAIELGLALVVGLAPLASEEALVLEAEERGIERTLLDGELVAGDLLDAEQDAVTVERAEGDCLQDEHVECALHEIELSLAWCLLDRLGESMRDSPRLSRRGIVSAGISLWMYRFFR